MCVPLRVFVCVPVLRALCVDVCSSNSAQLDCKPFC